ncbi:hypothetical protein BWI15_01770 [Kribbella sp. ALI-6-A]|uniref:hypothetical protein n=1 Tax=Kribbella sp. ALI-6-A TaxID=1933817 RepID=UPI00097BD239|nr:hypothetical protein [Kribbella sp. ALI-6-A]ONI78233.1 hypothetical protein BWI15_01770 [Kribbella sp. ALI-6-A]
MSTSWVPDACTLPTAEQPLRVAEFDRLFARTLRSVRRTGPTAIELELGLDARPELDDLIARETSCCSFFAFTVTSAGSGLRLGVTVPAAQTAVLDAFAERLPR